ncbi:hypothetical protein [Lentimicrobium sp. S6]|uniref:hypothetical protein n=1 Tax=Lentimicrobium sp. S6 TaxID=2735872 RepID=UPI001551B1BF|nr:hypothetical protein [Lentimicrobium sp. S6]NPD45717.1 hypothetical protein [Lentimicrobium sp. S6]
MNNTNMKGAVILIGSLLWENEKNALITSQGKLRAKWRNNLDLENKIEIKVPIRYGRLSGSKKNTYTMVFSNSETNLGSAFLIPFKEEAFNFAQIKKQALELSEAEGISTNKHLDRLYSTWGVIAISFNDKKKEALETIRQKWHNEFKEFSNSDYKLKKETPTVTKDGELNFNINLPDNIDYVFATNTTPSLPDYPSVKKIVEAINNSKPHYDTYVMENFNHGIRVNNDIEIINLINSLTNKST